MSDISDMQLVLDSLESPSRGDSLETPVAVASGSQESREESLPIDDSDDTFTVELAPGEGFCHVCEVRFDDTSDMACLAD